jgi:O-antigen/teichoic acid export membrane protein
MSKGHHTTTYRRNVLTLMSGSAISQALPIAAAPILTRLYTPDDFGVAALFLSATLVMASFVNGRYELAIGIPATNEDAINVAALGLVIAIIVSSIFLILVALFGAMLANILGAQAIAKWIYLLPVAVLLMGIFNVLSYCNIRLGKFKDITKANIYKSLVATTTQICFGLLSKGSLGLILGTLFAQLASNIRLFNNVRENFHLNQISRQRVVSVARRFKSFPKYSMWSGVLNTTAYNSVIFMMPVVFSIATLGFYNLAVRVLSAPAALISSAIGQAFLHEATKEKRLHGHAHLTFTRTVKTLALIGFPIFLCAYFLSELFFSFVFGEEWRIAGVYAAALTPLLFSQFVVSPVSMMNVLFEKNHIGFYWQLILALLSLGLIWVAYKYQWSFITYLWTISLSLSVHYLGLLAIMYRYNIKKV